MTRDAQIEQIEQIVSACIRHGGFGHDHWAGFCPAHRAKAVAPKRLAKDDLDAIAADLAATIEKAKADDPRALRKVLAEKDKRINELETAASGSSPAVQGSKAEANADLREKNTSLRTELTRHRRALEEAVKIIVKVKALDFSVDDAEQRKVLEQAVAAAVRQVTGPMEKRVTDLTAKVEGVRKQAGEAETAIKALLDETIDLTVHVEKREPFAVAGPRTKAAKAPPVVYGNGHAADGISPVQQRILNALAELEQLGARQPARELVAFMANYTHLQSKGFVNAMSSLSTAGCITYGAGTVALTDAGRAAAHAPEAPRTPKDVQDRVIAMLGGASGRILAPLIEAYPKAMPRQAVAERAGYGHLQSKGFVNAISRLRTLGFVDYPDRGSIVAQPVLFLEA